MVNFLNSHHILNTFYRFYLLNQCIKLPIIGNSDNQVPLENAIVGVDGNVSEHGVGFMRDNRCDVGHNSDIIVADNPELGGEHTTALPGPVHANDSVWITFANVLSIRTFLLVYLYHTVGGDKPEDVVTINRVAATGELIFQTVK